MMVITKGFVYKVNNNFVILKWKALNGITLEQRKNDSNNQLIIISK
jgi:hypothetical protein